MYDEIAQYYDWEHRDFVEDLDLYLGFAAASPGDVLEAACGTGRILVPLARAGYAATGVDLSPSMLSIARQKLLADPAGAKVKLVCGDMRALPLRHRYGMALVALGSFHHLVSTGEQRAALEGLASHLVEKGLLILDLVNPSPGWMAAGDEALVHQLTAPFPDENGSDIVSRFVARSLDFEDQVDHQLLLYDRTGPDGTLTRRSIQMRFRYLFRFEAELLLNECGFRVRELFGDYDLEQYGAASRRMIFVAERL